MTSTIVDTIPPRATPTTPTPTFWEEQTHLAATHPGRAIRITGFPHQRAAYRAATRINRGITAAARPAGTYHATARTEPDGFVIYLTLATTVAPAAIHRDLDPADLLDGIDRHMATEWTRTAA